MHVIYYYNKYKQQRFDENYIAVKDIVKFTVLTPKHLGLGAVDGMFSPKPTC